MARVKLRQTYDADLSFLDSLDDLTACEDVLMHTRNHLLAKGIERMSYHFVSPFHSQTGEPAVIYHHGFPDAWIRLYLDPAFRAADPVPAIVMAQTAPMTWRDAFAQAEDGEALENFIRTARACGVSRGSACRCSGRAGVTPIRPSTCCAR